MSYIRMFLSDPVLMFLYLTFPRFLKYHFGCGAVAGTDAAVEMLGDNQKNVESPIFRRQDDVALGAVVVMCGAGRKFHRSGVD